MHFFASDLSAFIPMGIGTTDEHRSTRIKPIQQSQGNGGDLIAILPSSVSIRAHPQF
jgi:hypothetical protein